MSEPLPWPNCPRCGEPLPPGPTLCPHCGAVTRWGLWRYAAGAALLLPALLSLTDYAVQGTCLLEPTDAHQRLFEALQVLVWGLTVSGGGLALAALVALGLRAGRRRRSF